MAIYNLTRKADIWWQDIKRVKNIKEKYVTCTTFKKYFKRKYLSKQYYEEKAKEFYDLRLSSMSMKELCSKFLSLLRYVPYIIDEKPKIQRFLSCLPMVFNDRIEYDNPKMLEEAMRKANFSYEQSKNKRDSVPNWKDKRGGNSEHKGGNFKFNRNFGNNSREFSRNNYQGTNFIRNMQQNSTTMKEKEVPTGYNKDIAQRGPLKCWECGEPHYFKDCPVRRRNFKNNVDTIQEEAIIGDIAREIPRINASLENRHAYHKTSMVEVEGMINNKTISILIDPGASLSCVSPSIAERCKYIRSKVNSLNFYTQ